jgi:acetylglutamate kinase
MKLVIKIGSTSLADDAILNQFVKVVGELLFEGHRIIVIHGGIRTPYKVPGNGNSRMCVVREFISNGDEALMLLAGRINKNLVALLARAGISAIGLCGADGNTVRTKAPTSDQGQSGVPLQVAAVDPFWLDCITGSGGVPVMANVAVGPDGQYQCVCADELAAASAIAWHANALIFLTRAEGVRDGNGIVMRWLEAEQIAAHIHSPECSSDVLSKLVACYDALQHGVHRVRIFPLSRIQSLGLFFRERIDFGTEIILSSYAAGR